MFRNLKRVVALVIAINIFTMSIPVNAYELIGFKLPGSPTIDCTYKWNTTNYSVKSMWISAKNNWNISQPKVEFSYSSSSSNRLGAGNVTSTTAYGWNAISHPGGLIEWFDAYINIGNPGIYDGSYDYTVGKSTGVHELGHSMGLDDLISGTAIMNIRRNRSSISVAKQDDINGVNAIY